MILLLPIVQSAVTWLCFSPNSEQIITASKDGSLRIWNINGKQNLIFFSLVKLVSFLRGWVVNYIILFHCICPCILKFAIIWMRIPRH